MQQPALAVSRASISRSSRPIRIGMIASISWRVPPRHYGPWELIASILTEGLVARGHDVTLFATADSITSGRLHAEAPRPYSEDPAVDPKVYEGLHNAAAFERADQFDVLHNHFDFMPITYSRLVGTPLVTTVHGLSSDRILPIYRAYDDIAHYVAVSEAHRRPDLTYDATIYHGIPVQEYPFRARPDDYLLFFGRIHPDKGTREAIEVAKRTGLDLIIAGIVADERYFATAVAPELSDPRIHFVGPVGPPERNALLGGARALIHLIDFDEPFGLSVVEAMATGTPVIAFPRGSLPEILRDGETGFLVPTVEAAIEAVGRIGELDRRACRADVEARFTAARMVSEYERLYRAILGWEDDRHSPNRAPG